MKLIENYKIGSDVEFFVKDEEQNEIISAEGLVRGTKRDPFCFMEDNPFFATSLDNVLVEGNIPPVVDKMEWLRNMNILRNYINSNLPKGMCTIALPAVEMNERWLQSEQARRFGCEPAFIVYDKSTTRPPRVETNLRTAGLHVHVSFDDANTKTIEKLIKSLDLFLSIPAVIVEPESQRKLNYGKAGEFRFGNAYSGCEYRSLSAWFADTEERLGWVYENTVKAIDFVNEGNEIDKNTGLQIRQSINENNDVLAQELINHYNIPVLV